MANLHVMARQRRINESLQNLERVAAQPAPFLPSTGLVGWSEMSPFLPFSRKTLYRMCAANTFPAGVRVGNRILWRVETFRSWLDKTLPAIYAEAA